MRRVRPMHGVAAVLAPRRAHSAVSWPAIGWRCLEDLSRKAGCSWPPERTPTAIVDSDYVIARAGVPLSTAQQPGSSPTSSGRQASCPTQRAHSRPHMLAAPDAMPRRRRPAITAPPHTVAERHRGSGLSFGLIHPCSRPFTSGRSPASALVRDAGGRW